MIINEGSTLRISLRLGGEGRLNKADEDDDDDEIMMMMMMIGIVAIVPL